MGKIFYIMGKSSSGKDTIYSRLLQDSELGLSRIVLYTTRPMREGETEGKEYHFTDRDFYEKLQAMGKVIEARTYQTVYGPVPILPQMTERWSLRKTAILVLELWNLIRV